MYKLSVMDVQQTLIPFLTMLHIYLCFRFAIRASFKYASVYSFRYMLLVILVPIVGYIIADRKLNKELLLRCTER